MDPISIGLGLAKFVPLAARWLVGEKAEEAAKEVINIAEKVTGRKGEDAEAALKADPSLQLQFKEAILKNEASLDRMYLKDRQDARARDVQLKQMGYKNVRADVMLIVIGIVLALDIYFIATANLKPEVLAIFNMMIGACLSMLGDAFQFEFGSSRGSKEKDFKLDKH